MRESSCLVYEFGRRPVSDDMMLVDVEPTCHWISLIQKFLKSFGWLADSFVLDFYKDCHFTRLPGCWQDFLPKLMPNELGWWLDMRNGDGWGSSVLKRGDVPPLGLTAFKCCTSLLSLKRKSSKLEDFSNDKHIEKIVPEFKKLFNKHVKPKKRLEIEQFSKVVTNICDKASTNHVFDVGSGLGHLARYLSYGCGLNLTCLDYVDKLGESATKFDAELQEMLTKNKQYSNSRNPPSHLCLKLELNKHEKHLHIQDEFGIIGLHSCGNLSPVIIHNYVNSPARFLVSVGCCYMKLDCNGFPLSSFGKSSDLKLSYEALEVSCHAIERYCQRLQDGQVSKLMIHAYRGALETILVNQFGIHRAGLKGVKNCEKISFEKYSFEAVQNLEEVTLTRDLVQTTEIETMLKDWYKIVLFYSLRLLIANAVETLVVLDRSLFIKENVKEGCVKIVALFDPELSPRNFAVIAERFDDL